MPRDKCLDRIGYFAGELSATIDAATIDSQFHNAILPKPEIRGNSCPPGGHRDAQLLELGVLERRKARTGRPRSPLRRRNRLDRHADARLANRFAGKLVPAHGAGVDGMIESVRVGFDQTRECVGEVAGKRRRCNDVVNDA